MGAGDSPWLPAPPGRDVEEPRSRERDRQSHQGGDDEEPHDEVGQPKGGEHDVGGLQHGEHRRHIDQNDAKDPAALELGDEVLHCGRVCFLKVVPGGDFQPICRDRMDGHG